MRNSDRRLLRCAIYTRKSSEEGLEQDFNSLHAQRESCEAYVSSQKHEGWIALPTIYDDGGYSGGSMDRPALTQLLADVRSGSIEVVVVYKVDRLTRSLADFAKIVEVFDAAGVSFVSVTQQFNTTSSMGRLTLNVLLSFAQFEREVTGERIRDKIAASKKKGMWMGGWVPLGYDRKDRTLIPNDTEARTVRTIFHLFLKLKNVRDVQYELVRLNLRTKPYAVQRGRATGNLPFARGHIYKILSNPLYLGEIEHKGARHSGQHQALITRETWDAVQARLAANSHAKRSRSNAASTNLLAGRIYDEAGNPLVSSHTSKNGKRYRYYVTSDGPARSPSSSNPTKLRIPAAQIDDLVLANLRNFLRDKTKLSRLLRESHHRTEEIRKVLEIAAQLADVLDYGLPERNQAAVAELVSRVIVAKASVKISINSAQFAELPNKPRNSSGKDVGADISIEVPFCGTNRADATKLLIEHCSQNRPDPVVVRALARARAWFDDLATGKAQSMAEIAARENITDNYVSNLIHLAWLAPKQVQLVLDGDAKATSLARTSMLARTSDPWWLEQDSEASDQRR
jgi:site-specific DNA recombinase